MSFSRLGILNLGTDTYKANMKFSELKTPTLNLCNSSHVVCFISAGGLFQAKSYVMVLCMRNTE